MNIKRRIMTLLLATAIAAMLAGCTDGRQEISPPGDYDYGDVYLAGADESVPVSGTDNALQGVETGGSAPAPGYEWPAAVEALEPLVGIWHDGLQYMFDAPAWDGERAWTELNNGVPLFDTDDLARTDAFETYSELDELGRCGTAYANICAELQPTESRGEIGNVRPSGWHTIRYNDLVSGNYLYNRCHLIGFQLAGENANEKNLITGTRYLNIDGMLDFENMIDDYVEETGNHVLYRVIPWFYHDELVCRGITMEAYSVEDHGEGVQFFVWAYNVQPGVEIDYATGESRRADGRGQADVEDELENGPVQAFVLNTKTGKFHKPECQYAESMSDTNRLDLEQSLGAMLQAGYSPCGSCRPDA